MKVAVGASSYAKADKKAIELLQSKGIEVVLNPYGRKLTEEETILHIKDADGLLAGLEPLNYNVLSQAPKLKAIARIGIGMDNVDIEAAKKLNIKVSNTPSAPTAAVAEMTLTALLSIARNLIFANENVHNKQWKKELGFSITNKNIFFIGYGAIGRKTAELMKIFNPNIMIYDKYNSEVSTHTLEDGLKNADIITLHASGKEEILTKELLGITKKGVVILNSARGGLINEDALYELLTNGHVKAFWGDALWEEPYNGKLLECNNAILTPHVCTYTTDCREDMEMQATLNLIRDLDV